MAASPQPNAALDELIDRACNENLDADGHQRLSKLLAGDAAAQERYVRIVHLHSAVRMLAQSDEFAMCEAEAALDRPTANSAHGEDDNDMSSGAVQDNEPNHSRAAPEPVTWFEALQTRWAIAPHPLGWLGAAALLACASLAVGLALRERDRASPPASEALVVRSDQDVPPARLTGAVGARWAGAVLERPEGEALSHNQRLELVDGLAEICFESGARIVLQGPAIVEVRDGRSALLQVGRIAANIPASANRFTLHTTVGELTSASSEFGVDVDVDGSLSTQVYSGELELALRHDGATASMQLSGGQGVNVDGRSGRVGVLKQPNELRFVRFLPRRDMLINLADVVAGGDGVRSVAADGYHEGISMIGGQTVDQYGAPAPGDGAYHRADGFEFIDGVFIPDGRRGPVQIDSIGRMVADFPVTSGDCWGGAIMARRPSHERSLPFIRLEYHGDNFGYVNWLHIASRPEELSPQGRGLIGMHSNSGITFDLHAIRARHPDKMLVKFRALVGNLESKAQRYAADAWVFVDGKLRYRRVGFSREDGPEAVELPLSDSDRFLALAVTDGDGSTAYDWAAFGDATIEMTSVDAVTADARSLEPAAGAAALGHEPFDVELSSRGDATRASLAGGL